MKILHDVNESRVLVLAPTAADAAYSRSVLAEAGLTCEICAELAELRTELGQGAGAVLLTEESLAAGNSETLIEALQDQPPWSDVPIVLLCAAGADSKTATWAMNQLGNVTVLERPVRVATLVSALRTAVRARLRQYRLRDQIEALRLSEQRFSRFMEHLPGLAWLKDHRGRYVYANESAINAFRVQRAELYGKTDDEVFPPETAQRFRANDRQALKTDRGVQTIEELRQSDGLHVSIVNKFPIHVSDSSPPLVGGMAIDITEQKRAEEALRHSEQQLRLVIDALPAVVTYIDRDYRFRFFNRTLGEWFNLQPGDVLGRTTAEVLGDEAFQDIRPRIEQALAGIPVHFEAVLPYRHGGTRVVDVKYVPDRQPDGTVPGYIALIHDITERRNNERLRLLHTAIVESSNDAIISMAIDGTILSWNSAAERIFGYAPEEVVGQPITTIIPPDLHEEEAVTLRRLADGEQIDNWEAVRVAKDGRLIDVSLTISPLRDAHGKFIGASKIGRDITVWKRTQAALRESEERYRRLMALLPVAVYTVEAPLGVITFCNEHAATLWGRTPATGDTDERFCGSFRLWRPDGTLLPHDQTPMALALREGCSFRNESVIIERPDGTRIDVLVNIDPIRDAEGNIVGAINAFHDTTALTRAQNALLESERHHRQVVQAMPLAVYTTDADGRITLHNRAAVGLWGREPDGEDRWCGSWRIFYPDGTPMPLDECPMAVTLREQRPVTGKEIVIECPDGTRRNILPYPEPLFDSTGRMTGAVNMLVDITDRKRAEESLREGEERFRTLADNIAQFAWTANELGWATWYNKRWYDYTGTTWEDMQGRGWELVTHPDHLDRVNTSLAEALAAGVVWEDVFPLRGRDGNYRWFLSRAVPIRDASGRIVNWFGTNTDITAQQEAEEKLRESDRRKDEFLAMLAHELRNPLAPIRSGLDVLCYELGDKHEIIQLMQEQIEHVVRLVDDLLDVSRIVRGRIDLRKEPVELSTIVYRAVSAVEATIDSRRHELRMSLPDDDVWLHADAVRLVQVVENLLNNAAKYTDEGGEIILTAESDGDNLRLSVRDNGIGIDEELMPRVFDLFTQSSRSLDRSQGGLGIGLTLVRNLVELHGGSISVTSAGAGQGSEFTVRLPVIAPPAKSRRTVPKAAEAAVTRRILVVDDNVAAAKMLALLLSKQNGHQVKTAHDGREALETLSSFRPEIVLLDIGLPGMNGYEVAEAIRERPEFNGVLLVALTGYGQQEDVERSRQAGFDEHLVKPPALDDLLRLMVHPRLRNGAGAKPTPAAKVRKEPVDSPDEDALAEESSRNGSESAIRTIAHELGNLAHAIRLAAHILKTSRDAESVESVREILEGIDESMGTLGEALRDANVSADRAAAAIDGPSPWSLSGH